MAQLSLLKLNTIAIELFPIQASALRFGSFLTFKDLVDSITFWIKKVELPITIVFVTGRTLSCSDGISVFNFLFI